MPASDYAVRVEERNFVLVRRRTLGPNTKNPGAEAWDAVGYFGKLEHLAVAAVDLFTREELGDGAVVGAESLREAAVSAKDEVRKLVQAVEDAHRRAIDGQAAPYLSEED
jgi:hypothetical protein